MEEDDIATSSTLGAMITVTSSESIESICGSIRKNRYDLTPDWQREFIWKPEQQSALIESILLGMPIPSIFLFEDSENKSLKKEVIDGKQRLTTISEFQKGNLKLSKLAVLPHLIGKTYSELSVLEQQSFDEYKLNINVIRSSDHDLKFRMFERLNTGGTILNPQEIRNCVFRGKMNDAIISMSSYKDFLYLMDRKSEDKRMEDQSYILSFAAFRDFLVNGKQAKQGGLKQVLNEYMRANLNPPDEYISKLKQDFEHAIKAIKIIYDKSAYRKLDTNGALADRTNVILFRIQMLSLISIPLATIQHNADKLRDVSMQMLKLQEVDDLISKATGNFDRTSNAYKIWKAKIDDTLRESIVEPPIATSRVSYSAHMRRTLYSKNNICSWCNNTILSESSEHCHIDHIVPISKGGSNNIENLQLLHPLCNQAKSNK